MRFFTLFFALLFSFSLSAQSFDWFANNPKWEVYFTAGWSGDGLEVVTVDWDTVLAGRQAKVLARPNFLYNHISVTAQSGDSIFLWDDEDQMFHLLYDMGAPIGTSFTQPLRSGSNTITYTISDTSSIQIGNYTLRTQTWAGSSLSSEYIVVEGVGMVSIIFQGGSVYPTHFFWNEPNNAAVDGEGRSLCFYTSDTIRYDPTPNVDECFGLVDTDVLPDVFTVIVAPNPSVDFIRFEIEKESDLDVQVVLFDKLGREIRRSSFFKNQYILQRENLASGLYNYTIKNKKGQLIQAGKVVFSD